MMFQMQSALRSPLFLGSSITAQAQPAGDFCKKEDDPYWRSRRNLPVDSNNDFVVLAGNSNPELSKKVASRLGTSLAAGTVAQFADGEVRCDFKADDVSGKHCYIV